MQAASSSGGACEGSDCKQQSSSACLEGTAATAAAAAQIIVTAFARSLLVHDADMRRGRKLRVEARERKWARPARGSNASDFLVFHFKQARSSRERTRSAAKTKFIGTLARSMDDE